MKYFYFGPLSSPVHMQLKCETKDVEPFEKYITAMNLLSEVGLITSNEEKRITQRISKMILNNIEIEKDI